MKAKILFFLILSSSFSQSQILEFYNPIIFTVYKDTIINRQNVNMVLADYYSSKISKIKKAFLTYDSDEKQIKLFDQKEKKFNILLELEKSDSSRFNTIGIFKPFDTKRIKKNLYSCSSSYVRYPSHSEYIDSIEILLQTKRNIILKIHYVDIFEWKYFGILVLTDFKYKDCLEDEKKYCVQ